MKANQTKKKDKKDKKKVKTSAPDLSVESVPYIPVTSKHAIEAVAEDLSDEESRSVEAKKQGKKTVEALVEEVAYPNGVLFF